MTDLNGKKITWLEYESRRLGITIEELREIMRERSLKADRSKSGFARPSLTKKDRQELSRLGVEARGKKDEADD